jgi:hypothetical protein
VGSNPTGPILSDSLTLVAMPTGTKFAGAAGWTMLFLAVALAGAAACANYAQIFPGDHLIAFVDGDCYARMTRVRELVAHPGINLAWHRFENYPVGTHPHTTFPFDGAILALRAGFKLAGSANALDLAGAWVSPLLGIAMIAGLWGWVQRERFPGGWAVLLVLAASPILAHGFALGRPDHQSLVVLCMAAALAAEWSFWRRPSRAIGMIGAAAWALGLWTSLYEPLILLVLLLVAAAVFHRATFRRRERLPGLAVGVLVLLGALAYEGWPSINVPGYGLAAGAEYFAAWSRQIGELQSLPPWSPTLLRWAGAGLAAAPVLLLLNRGAERRIARAHLFLLLAVIALTCWQARWGYFLPLVYALSLPWQTEAIAPRFRPVAAGAFLLGLVPMAQEWCAQIHPPPALRAALAEQREDNLSLHDVARFIARAAADSTDSSADPAGILAPWWLSPPLAYWSGQPALAGSSHESVPGIVEVGRFFVSADPAAAARILRQRQVRWVVAYEPDRVLSTAASLLNQPLVSRHALGFVLYQRPEDAPAFLRLGFVNPDFKVYEVLTASLPP